MDRVQIEIIGLDKLAEATKDISRALFQLQPDYQIDIAIGKPLLKIAEAINDSAGGYELDIAESLNNFGDNIKKTISESADMIANVIIHKDKHE